MRTKPTADRPVIVCRVSHVWGGMFMAYWDDRLNYPRQLSALFRRVDGKWTEGEAHPTGTRAGPILREAPAAVALALESATKGAV